MSALIPRNICRNAKKDFSEYNFRPRYCYWPLKILFCCPQHVNLTIGHSPINIRIFNNIQSPPSPFAVAVSNVCWPQTGGDQSSSGVPPPFPLIVPLGPPMVPIPLVRPAVEAAVCQLEGTGRSTRPTIPLVRFLNPLALASGHPDSCRL